MSDDYTVARVFRMRKSLSADDKVDLQQSTIEEFKEQVQAVKFWLSVVGMTATEIQEFLQGAIK